ncbi:MAG: AraC family transcriptional regulator [Chitinophagaceae bacterium]|nr:MAG: AraC family transcriptional regulator [Chitinophagaceae bacterium]
MIYAYQQSDGLLTDYIQTVLLVNGGVKNVTSDLPLFTNGMPALLYQTDNAGLHQVTVFGDSIPQENWKIDETTTMIVFLFKPFSLGPLFKLSALELKEKPIGLEYWNAQKWMSIRLQLIHSQSPEEKSAILNHFLVTQLESNKRDCEIIRYATDHIIQHSDKEVLAEILKTLNLTERTFQRIFKRYTGTTANQFRRICQFYFAFSQLKGKHFEKQTDIAFTNNYFDQSHYIRSFKEFTDTTPNDYLQFGLGKKKHGP